MCASVTVDLSSDLDHEQDSIDLHQISILGVTNIVVLGVPGRGDGTGRGLGG